MRLAHPKGLLFVIGGGEDIEGGIRRVAKPKAPAAANKGSKKNGHGSVKKGAKKSSRKSYYVAADLLALRRDTLEIKDAIAGGRRLVRDGEHVLQ